MAFSEVSECLPPLRFPARKGLFYVPWVASAVGVSV